MARPIFYIATLFSSKRDINGNVYWYAQVTSVATGKYAFIESDAPSNTLLEISRAIESAGRCTEYTGQQHVSMTEIYDAHDGNRNFWRVKKLRAPRYVNARGMVALLADLDNPNTEQA